MKIRCGIIGFGISARTFHIPFITAIDEFELSAVSTSRKRELELAHPGVRHYSDAEALLADGGLDLIIITSPNESHFPYAASALKAGKHVVVEKPFTLNSTQGRKLLAVAKKSPGILTVFHNRRWDADLLTISELLASDKLGRIYHFESNYLRFRPKVRDRWREHDLPGSGLLFDLGSHLLDQCVRLFGMPDWIQADVARQRPGAKIDDFDHILMGYGAMRAELQISSFVNGPLPRFALHGEKGSYIKYGMDPQEDQLKNGLDVNSDQFGRESEQQYGILYPAPVGSEPLVIPGVRGRYGDFYRQLAAAVADQGEVPVTAADALKVIRLIEQAKKSADTGRRISIL